MQIIRTTGRRKTAIATIQLGAGTGTIQINNRAFDHYFPIPRLRITVQQPLKLVDELDKYDIKVKVIGGGTKAQAEAIRLAIANGLRTLNPEYRKPLRAAGLVTRISAKVERKKYGHIKARKSPQFTKR